MANPALYRQYRRDKSGAKRLTSILVRRDPTHQELLEQLEYFPETGVFRHRKQRGKGKRGAIAGSLNAQGYVSIRFHNRLFMAHRLAWFYMTGSMPPDTIDHLNGTRNDNRWSNLRLATKEQQVWNSPVNHRCKSGLKGAWPCKTTGRWQSIITIGNARVWLGRFDTAEEAHAAWIKAATDSRGKEWTHRN